MHFETWYLYPVAAAISGGVIGWLLHSILEKRRHTRQHVRALTGQISRLNSELETRQQAIDEADARLVNMLARLAAQEQREQNPPPPGPARPTRMNNLLPPPDYREQPVHQGAPASKADHLRDEVHRHIEELDWLTHLRDNYDKQIKHLTQQAQRLDGNLNLLKQTLEEKDRQIDERKALIELREAELRRLRRQYQQREIDLVNAQRMLDEKNADLGRLTSRMDRQRIVIAQPPAWPDQPAQPISDSSSSGASRMIVNPALPAETPIKPDDEPEDEWPELDESHQDDLTEIPGLAELYARQLYAKGIHSFAKLARMKPIDVDRVIDIPGHYSPDIEGWIESAERLAARHQHNRP